MSHDAKPTVATGKYAGCKRVLVDGGMVRKLSDKEVDKFRAAVERVGMLKRINAWWRDTYGDSLARQRRAVEEDARRLHGRVIWDDTQ